jgi:FkbM family methyltransferase
MTSKSSDSPPFFAQFGEDRILDEIFRHKATGTCVEVGANDGIMHSMSYHFELLGWRCLVVEPVPELFRKIRENRRCVAVNCAASSSEGETSFFFAEEATGMSSIGKTRESEEQVRKAGGRLREIVVRKRTLDAVLEEAGFDSIDFVSIDVEGHEMEVLNGFSLERFRPRIVLVEDNSGGTDPAVPDHMAARGYVVFRRTGVNDWYARGEDEEIARPERIEEARKLRAAAAAERRLAKRFAFLLPFVPDRVKIAVRRAIERLQG